MLHVLQAFGGPGRTAVSFAPTYSMYPEYARDTHTAWVVGRRAEDFTLDPEHAREVIAREQPSVVLLASPNNPTGTALPAATVEAVCEAALAVRVRSPGAGGARRRRRRRGVRRVPARGNAVGARAARALPQPRGDAHDVKAFALAGARVGYLAASRDLVDALRVVRLPYHLSAVTQAVARAALAHSDELLAQVSALRERRDETVAWLRSLRHPDGRPVEVAESDANFVLFGTFADRHAVWAALLERGVLIRETGPDGWLRVSIGTGDEMRAFRQALVEVAGL